MLCEFAWNTWTCCRKIRAIKAERIAQLTNSVESIDVLVCVCVCVVVWENFYHRNMHQFEIKLAVFPLELMISVYIAVVEYIRLLSMHPSISLYVTFTCTCMYLCKCKICICFFYFHHFDSNSIVWKQFYYYKWQVLWLIYVVATEILDIYLLIYFAFNCHWFRVLHSIYCCFFLSFVSSF